MPSFIDTTPANPAEGDTRERLLRLLAAGAFVVFFQAFMIAPIIPQLAAEFGTSVQRVGLIVPAYLIAYGIATLVYGFLADRIGIWQVMGGSLLAFIVLSALTVTARSVEQLTLWRALTGLGASRVVPLALVLVGRLVPYERRGRPLGWLFGAMAGGMAFGSTFGAVLEPFAGWRGLFLIVAALGAVILLLLLPQAQLIESAARPVVGRLRDLLNGYRRLYGSQRGQRTYSYVLVNSVFHSGVFTWLGVYLERRYALGPIGVGLALLGYGVPGFVFGPLIGRFADRWGRARLLPIGLALSALAAAILIANVPLIVAAVAITILSLGYDMTQPLFGGIVTSLDESRPGQAMGLNVFVLFIGFGIGGMVFGALLRSGFTQALTVFAVIETVAAVLSIALFRSEVPVQGAT